MGRPKGSHNKRDNVVRLPVVPPHVHIIDCDDHIRVWRSWDPGDVFDVIPKEGFDRSKYETGQLVRIPLRNGFPEADSGEVVCDLCKRGES